MDLNRPVQIFLVFRGGLGNRSESEKLPFSANECARFPSEEKALKLEEKDQAVNCNSSCGPFIYDIGILENCSANANNYTTTFGPSDAKNTGVDGTTLHSCTVFHNESPW
jgi:hypothetical protein